MGRLAGPKSRRSRNVEWKREVEERRAMRRYARPEPLLAVPSAGKRQQALLWVIAEHFRDGLVIGWKRSPPLTSDMRILIGKGMLGLTRRGEWEGSRRNILTVTEIGRQSVRANPPDARALEYIVNALQSASLR